MNEVVRTFDLEDRIEELEADLEEVKEATADAIEASENGAAGFRLTDAGSKLEQKYNETTKVLNSLREDAEEYDDTEFECRRLSYGDVMEARDHVQAQAEKVGGGSRDGYYQIRVIEAGLVSTPPGAPGDAENLGYHVGSWLFDCIDRLATGEAGEGNSSLWDEVS